MRRSEVLLGASRLYDARKVAENPDGEVAKMRSMGTKPWDEGAEALVCEIVKGKVQTWRNFHARWSGTIPEFIEFAAAVFGTDAKAAEWWPVVRRLMWEVEVGGRPSEDLYEAGTGRKVRGMETRSGGAAATDADSGPTAACFDCGGIFPVEETWVDEKGLALCQGCFGKREAKGRARRRRER